MFNPTLKQLKQRTMEKKLFVVSYLDYYGQNTLIIEAENGLEAIGIARNNAKDRETVAGVGSDYNASEIIKTNKSGILFDNPC